MPERVTDEDLELLGELGLDAAPAPGGGRSPREQRVIAGFEEIERFAREHGRPPRHGEGGDIFERLYAMRLDRLRALEECRAILAGRDPQGLLLAPEPAAPDPGGGEASDEALLAALGVGVEEPTGDITTLTHVRSREEIQAAEEVAQRTPCADFGEFAALFGRVQADLDAGRRQTLKYQDNADVNSGDLFILNGQKVLVAARGDGFVGEHGRPDARLRAIYDNGTESDLLLRSLQRALNKDRASRRITEPDLGPLFAGEAAAEDSPAGCIYVLQSQSDHPFIAERRSVIHKIGVTGGDVKRRVAAARKDPTYLLADVTVVGTFQLFNLHRTKLEALLHRFLAPARLDLELKDRFGGQVEPREWYLVPLPIIEEAVEKLMAGTIGGYRYDPGTARIVEQDADVNHEAPG